MQINNKKNADAPGLFGAAYFEGFADKFGIASDLESSRPFIEQSLGLLAESKVDFTIFFTRLTHFRESGAAADFYPELIESEDWKSWLKDWAELQLEQKEGLKRMRGTNPVIIPRNHRIEEAIEAGMKGDYSVFHRLVEALSDPYREREEYRDLEFAPEKHEVVKATFCGT